MCTVVFYQASTPELEWKDLPPVLKDVYLTCLEGRDNLSLQSKWQACLLSSVKNSVFKAQSPLQRLSGHPFGPIFSLPMGLGGKGSATSMLMLLLRAVL